MNAAEVLDELRTRGVTLAPDGGRLRWRAPPGVMAPEMVDELRAHKTELLALLSGGVVSPGGTVDWYEWFEERAAIIEHDGGLPGTEAETRAFECAVVRWLNENPPLANGPERCGHCGKPMAETDALPFLAGASGHIWMHGRCHAPWMNRRRAEAVAALGEMGVTPRAGTQGA